MKYIEFEIKNKIGYLTLNRPDKRNALNGEMVNELIDAFGRAEESDEIKIIILNARGSAFCAGADLAYLQQLQNNTYNENLEDSSQFKRLFEKIYSLKKVVIASVHGHAIAGGCGLATVCDFCFSAPEAKFGYTEVKIGFVPAIVMVFLIRKIGDQRARSLLLSGDLITSEVAVSLGLINKVVEKDKLEEFTNNFASKLITSNSPESMAMTKQMMARIQDLPLTDATQYAAEMNAKARETKECKKGISSFIAKNPIIWE